MYGEVCAALDHRGQTDVFFLDFSRGGGPGTEVKAACLESRRSRAQSPLWHSSLTLLTRQDSVLWGV